MKTLVYFCFSVFLLFQSQSVYSQHQLSGSVTEIIDGRTLTITSSDGNRINVLLKDIEVPENGQQLHQVVKDHITKLVLNKNVKVVQQSTYSKGITGTIFLGEIDICLQMIRDGAAWFNLPEGINSIYFKEYTNTENLAKAEKRGVWSITDLKPAWEFRNEQLEKIADEKKAQTKRQAETIAATQKETIWADIPETVKSKQNTTTSRSVSFEYDEFTDEGVVHAPLMILNLEAGGKKILGLQYRFKGNKIPKGGNRLILAIADSDYDYDDEMIFLTDKGDRIRLGRGQSTGSRSSVYFFYINRGDLIKIANSETAYVRIGVSKAVLDQSILGNFRKFLIAID